MHKLVYMCSVDVLLTTHAVHCERMLIQVSTLIVRELQITP